MNPPALPRELHENERDLLFAHLVGLEPEARRLRFASPRSDEALRQYVDGIDFARDAVFVVTDAELVVLGAAHLALDEGHAELGLSVLPQARGRGIGAALLERCAARARNAGAGALFMNCLSENAPMMRLARRQGLHVALSQGEGEAFVQLPQASLASVASEAVAESLAVFDHAQKAQWLALRKLWVPPPAAPPATP